MTHPQAYRSVLVHLARNATIRTRTTTTASLSTTSSTPTSNHHSRRCTANKHNQPTSTFFSTKTAGGVDVNVDDIPPLPESIKRVGQPVAFPNEYPGQNYAFNWCLAGDGVTNTKKAAFRITKPLDLKVAGLNQAKVSPLKVTVPKSVSVPEAGSDELPFDTFDDVSQRVRDALSISNKIYCPEGHAPGTHVDVRIITNSARLTPDLLAYLDRAPKKDPPTSLSTTVYVMEQSVTEEKEFAGYSIEIVEDDTDEDGELLPPKSVASVVVTGENPSLEVIVKGIELSVEGITADAEEAAAAEGEEGK